MRVICTAGHVDHGKSTLVHALTGINPDRLSEEIERQMTIDLGFAWVNLPDGETVGIVDVPGHEDFIENMLAGIGGLDAALLIVAADEGVMPQTREHVAILELMGITSGIVALTKIDAAESQEWIELIELDVMELLSKGSLANIPIVRVSAHTGMGLEQLVDKLTEILSQQPLRHDLGRPVLPIDRVFTLSGFGTVVTGTLSDGTLSVGQIVEIQPGGIEARIRGLQSHEQSIEIAQPGSRLAVNLSGVDKSQIRRGDVLSLPGFIQPTLLFDAAFEHLASASRPLKHNAQVKIFVGHSEAVAKIRLLDTELLKPGENGFVQFQLERPLPLQNDQRFVVRIPSPAETIGGGRVLDTAPGRTWKRHQREVLERFTILTQGDLVERLAYELKMRRVPQSIANYSDSSLVEAAKSRYGVYELEGYLVHPEVITQMGQDVSRILTAFHTEFPLLAGMDATELLRRLHLSETDTIALTALAAAGLIQYGRLIKLPGQGMNFTKAQRRAVDNVLTAFDANPFAPPSYKDVLKELSETVLRALVAQGELVFLRPDILLRPDTYNALVDYARQQLGAGESLTVISLRDHFQTSRRIALPFLDHLEANSITRRVDDAHILRQSNWDALLLP